MKLVGINILKAGERLGYPVYSASGKIVLNTGTIVTEGYIDRLKNLGIYSVYIDDEQFKDIKIVEAVNVNTRNNAYQVFRQAYDAYHKGKDFDEYKIVDVVKMINEDVKYSSSNSINIIPNVSMDDYLACHSVNVCILSIIIGNNMNYNYNQLLDLGVGAFVHDLSRKLNDDDGIEHVQKGFENIKKYRGISLHSAKIIYEHHENYDGSGFPRKVSGAAISEYSRIVTIADNYDRLTFGEGNSRKMLPHEAYEIIIAETNKKYDPAIVNSFRNSITFYPNGCTVKLNNGQKGIVVNQNAGAPQRPFIRLLEPHNGIGELNLMTNLTLFIESVDI